MFRVVVIVLACLIGFAGCAGSSFTNNGAGSTRDASEVTFGSSWNSHCGSCNFMTNAGATLQTSLGDLYRGSDFEFDINRLDSLITFDLGEPSGLAGADISALYVWYDNDADDPW